MIFVDSGAWFAAAIAKDPDHRAARTWFAKNNEELVTTDYVFDEVATLFRARNEYQRGVEMGQSIWSGAVAELVFVEERDLSAAWSVFKDYSDKAWSFTDCVSKVVIERLKIDKAFTFDEHFRQFGSVTVVP